MFRILKSETLYKAKIPTNYNTDAKQTKENHNLCMIMISFVIGVKE